MATVTELISYPVKGCAGTPAAAAELTPAGLPHDRSFLVVGPEGVFRSQRTDPRLAVVRPEVSTDGTQLTLNAPGLETLHLDIDLGDGPSPRCEVEMFGDPYRAVDQGDRAAEWLSEALGAASRLVRAAPEHDRVTDGLTPGTSGFADSSPVHVISLATFDDLNRRITAAGRSPVPMDRFRPNIVVDGWDAPQTEDRARRVTVGGGELGFAKLAVRCAVTLVDQRTGGKAGPEPLRTLASYRRVPEGGVAFGSKFSVLGTGKVAVGDAFEVTEWGTD
ncbi:MOSC domain-containing protein [Streptomyces decoyicus]|uniref:MOSC domain-containing protein n=1 Tax=Streptomyces decoyicus TaxID=249567 RepID=UPI0004AAD0BD|nr:MOSC N-terminal beta barrel domain-containing protein [Streptomyces decoyicus]KOG38481.1 molybdenum cofactor sulfurase [Streptomyces decoyicus]QZY17824.1 MOSC N-terminal beta barrel domain-containing protein [Streptomyces decoyicus]